MVLITVDWQKKTGIQATTKSYGLNAYQYTNPAIATDPLYQTRYRYMKPGFTRLHNLEQMRDSSERRLGWVINANTPEYRWDEAKIAECLNSTYTNTTLLLNIANWCSYMDDGAGKLRTDMFDAYAAFCAELVNIVNIKLGKGVQYIEVTNEKDSRYRHNMAEMATIFNKCYDVIKLVDPSVKVGGIAWANAYASDDIEEFIRLTKDKVDFLSYHTYNGVSATSTTASTYDAAQKIDYPTTLTRRQLKVHAPDRADVIELFHNEYNMQRTTSSINRGWLINSVSLVFDALALRSLLLAGVNGANGWNEGDGYWGKFNTDNDYTLRPAAHLYKLLNEQGLGEVVSTVTDNPTLVQSYGLTTPIGRDAVVLINRSGVEQPVSFSFSNWDVTPSSSTYTYVYQADVNGYTTRRTNYGDIKTNGVIVPADSAMIVKVY